MPATALLTTNGSEVPRIRAVPSTGPTASTRPLVSATRTTTFTQRTRTRCALRLTAAHPDLFSNSTTGVTSRLSTRPTTATGMRTTVSGTGDQDDDDRRLGEQQRNGAPERTTVGAADADRAVLVDVADGHHRGGLGHRERRSAPAPPAPGRPPRRRGRRASGSRPRDSAADVIQTVATAGQHGRDGQREPDAREEQDATQVHAPHGADDLAGAPAPRQPQRGGR